MHGSYCHSTFSLSRASTEPGTCPGQFEGGQAPWEGSDPLQEVRCHMPLHIVLFVCTCHVSTSLVPALCRRASDVKPTALWTCPCSCVYVPLGDCISVCFLDSCALCLFMRLQIWRRSPNSSSQCPHFIEVEVDPWTSGKGYMAN